MCDTVHIAVLSRDEQHSVSHLAQQQSQSQTYTTKNYIGECWNYRKIEKGIFSRQEEGKIGREEEHGPRECLTVWQILKSLSELKAMFLIKKLPGISEGLYSAVG